MIKFVPLDFLHLITFLDCRVMWRNESTRKLLLIYDRHRGKANAKRVVLYPKYYDKLLISVICFNLKENEISGYYFDNCGSCVDYALRSGS